MPRTQSAEPEGLPALVRDYLDAQYDALVAGEKALRAGQLDQVHPTRVATRRYRTVLHDMRDLFDSVEALVLQESLRWYAGVLGELRDVQVLTPQLLEEIDALPDKLVLGSAREILRAHLAAKEQSAVDALRKALDSKRYAAMMARLCGWHQAYPFYEVGPSGPPPERAVKGYLKRATRRYRKRRAMAAEKGDSDARLHEARKAAKRARYLAELAKPALGKKAKHREKEMTGVQDRLGARQDRSAAQLVLMELVQQPVDEATPEAAASRFTFGLLYARHLRPAS